MKQLYRSCLVGAAFLLATLILIRTGPTVQAIDSQLLFDEILAGANGDSAVQFIEIRMAAAGQNCWGPQVAVGSTPNADADDGDCFRGANETRSRAALLFYDAAGRETGRYKFPENPPSGADVRVLVATQAFANLPGAPAPDFVMPPLLNAVNGKVCFGTNPENVPDEPFLTCVSYGAFAGTNDGEGGPAPALSTTDTISLARLSGTAGALNSQFSRETVPTPTNSAGQTFTMTVAGAVAQGEALFTRESFSGNGRTCATCHVADLSLRLPPENVQSRFATLSTTFDPLFVAESNMNLNVLTVDGRPAPVSGTDFLNASGGDLQGVITSSTSATAKVLGRTSATTYLVQGGLTIGGVVTDAAGNEATVASVTAGDLNGLESPARMRTSRSSAHPQGRALILENIDGFTSPAVFRKSPHLINLIGTGPFGLSGEFADLQTFAAVAVAQHLTRSLSRIPSGANPDFRPPTAAELVALEAFMLSRDSIPGNDPDKFNLDRFVTTAAQQSGRNAFIIIGCANCHGGRLLATTTRDILGKGVGVNGSFDTGVANQSINGSAQDNLPCEPLAGACNRREFSVPSLFNVGNTAPYFHDNSARTLEEAVAFYCSSAFLASPANGAGVGNSCFGRGGPPPIAAFLRSLDAAPKVGDLALRSVPRGASIAPIPFIVKDPDTPLDNLTWSITSSDHALMPPANVQVEGTGNNRMLSLTPVANVSGRATLTVTASDGVRTGSNTTSVTVNTPPTITQIANQVLAVNASTGPLPFVVGDEATIPTVTASSSNVNFVPGSGITLGGAGTSRTITIKPAADAGGTATITVRASDGLETTSMTFTVTVTKESNPQMALDGPASGALVSQPFVIAGWAIDAGVVTSVGTGVDVVHVWAFPVSGGSAVLLGAATYGQTRSDISTMLGSRYSPSGFKLIGAGLTEGVTYDISVFARSTVTGTFNQVRTTRVTIVPGSPDPVMALDFPAPEAVVTTATVGGWAIDRGGGNATSGVDAVHVWAFPEDGRPPIFVGVATYGNPRPDVAAIFGANFASSGFQLPAASAAALTPGVYTIGVYARSQVTSTFNQHRSVRVTVVPATSPRMALDAPANEAVLDQPFDVTGWALDSAPGTGTGVNSVHVWAFPVGGGSPVFVGAAAYGISRPDVAAAFGNTRFTNSGFRMQVSSLLAGVYDLGIFARSVLTGTFSQQRLVRVTINAPPPAVAMAARTMQMPSLGPPIVEPSAEGLVQFSIDTPLSDALVGSPFVIEGSALDAGAVAGAGIGGVHIWANGEYVGMAEIEGTRWRMNVPVRPPGDLEISCYVWLDRTQRFEVSRTVRVVVR